MYFPPLFVPFSTLNPDIFNREILQNLFLYTNRKIIYTICALLYYLISTHIFLSAISYFCVCI